MNGKMRQIDGFSVWQDAARQWTLSASKQRLINV